MRGRCRWQSRLEFRPGTAAGPAALSAADQPATGREVHIDVIDIVTVRDGRYAEHWGINTLTEVLARLKLP